ncbi:MAG: class I SAM-dependent methyltransferase [Planctomycetaceae bacterium]
MMDPDGSNEDCLLLQRLRHTPSVFEVIASCTDAELKNQKRLREQFDEELVRAALSLHEARRRAASVLPRADQLWLTRVGLEQSTNWQLALYKASRFQDCDSVTDLCCGIGIDAAALSRNCEVQAIDSDPSMVLRCQWNADILRSADRDTSHPAVITRCLDVTAGDWNAQIVHADPDRRAGRDRPVKRLEQYQPPLEWMQHLTKTAAGGAIKISPASNFTQKFPECEIELISLDGECREATVWFGHLKGNHPFRATVLTSKCSGSQQDAGVEIETISIDPLSAWAPQAAECGAFLFDPDPAVVRSGMLDGVAELLSLERLDPEEEYLTGQAPVESVFVKGFLVEAILPNNIREVRQWLRKNNPSSDYEIKCRRIPTDAHAVRKQLPTGDDPPRTILFARIAGRTRVVIARRLPVKE